MGFTRWALVALFAALAAPNASAFTGHDLDGICRRDGLDSQSSAYCMILIEGVLKGMTATSLAVAAANYPTPIPGICIPPDNITAPDAREIVERYMDTDADLDLPAATVIVLALYNAFGCTP